MSNRKKPLPKSQGELSQETINPLLNQGKVPLPDSKKRENQRRRDKDDVKDFTVGLSDIDTAIIYYFNNVIRPSVIKIVYNSCIYIGKSVTILIT